MKKLFKIYFSLSTIPSRASNLELIIPIILEQADLIYVNLVGYLEIPKILNNSKIIVNKFDEAGSEIRFYNYKDIDEDSYYFTIDDDILYPKDYSKVMIEKMIEYENKVVCCVHGSNIDKNLNEGFYKKNRRVFHFRDSLSGDTKVMIVGIGTSCFYKNNVRLNIEDYEIKNMSDVYTSSFLAKQQIERISISREYNWIIPLNEFNSRISGKNPYEQIDKIINETKEIL